MDVVDSTAAAPSNANQPSARLVKAELELALGIAGWPWDLRLSHELELLAEAAA